MVDHSLVNNLQLGTEFGLDHSPASSELDNLLRRYLLACKVEDKSPKTIESYYGRVGAFLNFQQKILLHQIAKEINPHDIRLYLLSLHQRNLSGSYINAHYRAIKTFFNWLIAEGFLATSPMENIRSPRIPNLIVKPFSRQDIDNLLLLCLGNRFLDLRNRAMILVFLDTGIRLAEMSGIQLKDVNFDRETVKVMGKGAKERVVRIGKTAQKALLKYLLSRNDNHDCLWVTEERRPLTAYGVQTVIKRLCHRASITDARLGPHTFRHTFAINFLRNGGDVFSLQIILGHSTLTMTRRYVSILGVEDAFIAHQKASPVDRLFSRNK